MCNLSEGISERAEARGEARGKANGIIGTGMKYGISVDNILSDLQETLGISLQKAQEYLQEFGRKTV